MIKSRLTAVNVLAVTIKPPFDERANAVTARSISSASRTPTGHTSTPNDGAAAWITANWPIPEAMSGSRSTATRFSWGEMSLSSSSHFALMTYFEHDKSGGIAARLRKAIDEAGANWVDDTREYHRHSAP
jgi:hypothetical protein